MPTITEFSCTYKMWEFTEIQTTGSAGKPTTKPTTKWGAQGH